MNRRSFLFPLAASPRVLSLFAQGAKLPPLPVFADVTRKSGVRFKHEASRTSQKYLPESMAGGVAMFDYDGDGRLDLYFVNGARFATPCRRARSPDKSDPRYLEPAVPQQRRRDLHRCDREGRRSRASYGMGVAAGDYDNDGRPDLYVTNFGGNILYHNNGDGTFTDVTERAGVAGGGWSSSACFVDYDGDGWLDLVVSRYLEWDFDKNIWCGPREPGYRGYCHPDRSRPSAISSTTTTTTALLRMSPAVRHRQVARLRPGRRVQRLSTGTAGRTSWWRTITSPSNCSTTSARASSGGGAQGGLAYDEDGERSRHGCRFRRLRQRRMAGRLHRRARERAVRALSQHEGRLRVLHPDQRRRRDHACRTRAGG